ncbi:MAG TPA: inositol monophosphatase family protein [Bryobacteraceae bacterium]|nr:inositol monophosphatase family protein [Bryobacteraceae bacterium]
MTRWLHELEVAVEASRQAAELALRYQPGIVAETKPDDSPVTIADREGERLIARILSEAFPEDGLMGEEGTRAESRSGRRWIIDPIDGTRDYVRGNSLWANLIALEDHGEVVAGVVHLPMLAKLYTGARGGGAFCNGAKIQASRKKTLEESVLCFNAFNKIQDAPFREPWLNWMAHCWAMRGLGGAPDAMMVASGQAEIWIEPSASPWDFAPLKIILEEAGARYFNLDGGASIYDGNCVACAPGLEPAVRQMLGLAI